MNAVDYAVWWVGIFLEILLLARALRTKLPYRVFYLYVFFVLLQSVVRLMVYHYNENLYDYVYWATEFIGVFIGCGIVYEIYRRGLASFPGTARMARRLLTLVFALALAKALADATSDPRWWAEATTMDVERALRTVQAFAIVALVGLFILYSIPFGRNLKGILIGYGMFIGVSVVWFTFMPAESAPYRHAWSVFGPATYDLALSVWVVYLWNSQPQPELASQVRLEEQYQLVASRTRRRLRQARVHLGKVMNR
jgi:hypothetical protein